MPDNHGQFVLMQSPGALPGKCGGCGKATEPRGFIDTGFDADFYGVLYYCYECVLDMASKFGFVTPEVVEELKRRIGELEVETTNQRAAILGLEDTVDGLLRVRDSGASDITVPAQPDTPIEPEIAESIAEQDEFPDILAPVTEPDVEFGNPEINDNAGEQESAGISVDDGLASWAELSI